MLQDAPNTLLDKYGIEFCVLARTSPMAQVLPLLPNWKSVYADTMSMIFVRTSDKDHRSKAQQRYPKRTSDHWICLHRGSRSNDILDSEGTAYCFFSTASLFSSVVIAASSFSSAP